LRALESGAAKGRRAGLKHLFKVNFNFNCDFKIYFKFNFKL
jgi:hypothetical protein